MLGQALGDAADFVSVPAPVSRPSPTLLQLEPMNTSVLQLDYGSIVPLMSPQVPFWGEYMFLYIFTFPQESCQKTACNQGLWPLGLAFQGMTAGLMHLSSALLETGFSI